MNNSNNSSTVLVAGATGFLGCEICRQLSEKNIKVKGLVRTTSDANKVTQLKELGVEIVEGDLKDKPSLENALHGVSAIISTVSSTLSRQEGDSIQTVDDEGQNNLIAAAIGANIKQFVYVSFCGMPGQFPLQIAKRKVEKHLAESGLNYTILQPTYFMDVWLSPALGFDYPNTKATIYGEGKIMDLPGITVEPIVFASGTHEVNQVFFDNVRVPKANIVGEENDGWTVAKYLLEFERGGGGAARFHTALKHLRNLAEETNASGQRLLDDASFARKLNETGVQVEAIQFTEFRIMAEIAKGGSPGPESSIMKTLGADMGQYMSELMVEALGFYATPHQPEAREVGQNVPIIGPDAGVTVFPRYFNLRASSIAGGSNEVQRNIVAKLVLGL